MTKTINIESNTLDVGAAFASLQDPEAGGIGLFVGTTRQWTGKRETRYLEYDCYEPLARGEMERLADEAGRRWPVVRVCLHHRLGVVPAGEASVIVGVATPHRADAFAATRFLIDALKQQVPIWKREIYADGSAEWVEGPSPPEVPDAGWAEEERDE